MEILLVEDVDTDAELALRALKKVKAAGRLARVHEGHEALDALFYAKSLIFRDPLSPKVIMLDVGLPKIDRIRDGLLPQRPDRHTSPASKGHCIRLAGQCDCCLGLDPRSARPLAERGAFAPDRIDRS